MNFLLFCWGKLVANAPYLVPVFTLIGFLFAAIRWTTGSFFHGLHKLFFVLKLLRYLKKPLPDQIKSIDKLRKILDSIDWNCEITQSLKKYPRCRYAIQHRVFWLLKPYHDGDLGPFCPNCVNIKDLEIHLKPDDPKDHGSEENRWACPECNFRVDDNKIGATLRAHHNIYSHSLTNR